MMPDAQVSYMRAVVAVLDSTIESFLVKYAIQCGKTSMNITTIDRLARLQERIDDETRTMLDAINQCTALTMQRVLIALQDPESMDLAVRKADLLHMMKIGTMDELWEWARIVGDRTTSDAPKASAVRARYEVAGGHVHVRVFSGAHGSATLGNSGRLVFDAAHWPEISAGMTRAGWEVVPE